MKIFIKSLTVLTVIIALAPALAAQATASFTGKWEGTFKIQNPDGTEREPKATVFNLTQKGKALEGSAGPPESPWKIEQGVVNAGKATFAVQQPGGPLFRFTLTIVKGAPAGRDDR